MGFNTYTPRPSQTIENGWIGSGVKDNDREVGVTFEVRRYDDDGSLVVYVKRGRDGSSNSSSCWMHKISDIAEGKEWAAKKAKRIGAGIKGDQTMIAKIAAGHTYGFMERPAPREPEEFLARHRCGHEVTFKCWPYDQKSKTALIEGSVCKACRTVENRAQSVLIVATAAQAAKDGLPEMRIEERFYTYSNTCPTKAQWLERGEHYRRVAIEAVLTMATHGTDSDHYPAAAHRLFVKLLARTDAKWWYDLGTNRYIVAGYRWLSVCDRDENPITGAAANQVP